MPLGLLHIDAFTNRPLTGNPAAVCLLEEEADPRWMQALGNEMNLPETAFVRPIAGPPGSYELRWFTPAIEVDLCGHATIASAHALWQEDRVPAGQPIYFHTRSGILAATKSGDLIELDFPSLSVTEVAPPAGLLEALGWHAVVAAASACEQPTNTAMHLAPNDMPTRLRRDGIPPSSTGSSPCVLFTGKTQFDLFLEIDSPDLLRGCTPNFFALAQIPTRGIIVTSRSDDERYDYLARFFAPATGIPEDHATGSAHCALAPYWQQRLSKDKFTAYQASPRTGVIHTHVRNDRITLAGQAVTIFRGELEA